MVTSVLGHFGPFLRTEMTKDRTGSATSVLRTELHIKRPVGLYLKTSLRSGVGWQWGPNWPRTELA